MPADPDSSCTESCTDSWHHWLGSLCGQAVVRRDADRVVDVVVRADLREGVVERGCGGVAGDARPHSPVAVGGDRLVPMCMSGSASVGIAACRMSSDGTHHSACSRPSSTRFVKPQPSEIKQADRAKHRAHHPRPSFRHPQAEDLRSKPSFAEQPNGHVTVRLPIESPISPDERAWTRELEDRAVMLSEDRRVLIEAARGTELTNAIVRSLLNIDSAAARQSLQRLRDAGLLEQDGERRGARYRIVPGLRRPVWIGLDRAELCSTILDMAVHGSVTNMMVRQELGLSRNEAVALLKGLVAEGLLELRGSKRGSHYVLVEPA